MDKKKTWCHLYIAILCKSTGKLRIFSSFLLAGFKPSIETDTWKRKFMKRGMDKRNAWKSIL